MPITQNGKPSPLKKTNTGIADTLAKYSGCTIDIADFKGEDPLYVDVRLRQIPTVDIDDRFSEALTELTGVPIRATTLMLDLAGRTITIRFGDDETAGLMAIRLITEQTRQNLNGRLLNNRTGERAESGANGLDGFPDCPVADAVQEVVPIPSQVVDSGKGGGASGVFDNSADSETPLNQQPFMEHDNIGFIPA